MSEEKYFRGFHAIKEVAQRLTPIVDHAKKFSPDMTQVRLFAKDYDLVERWPKAAAMHGFTFDGDAIFFHGMVLRSYDSVPRYKAKLREWLDR